MKTEPTKPTPDDVERWLCTSLSNLLGLDANRIDPSSSLHRLGLDSLVAVGLTEELGRWLGRDLEPTLFFDCGTIRAIARKVGHAAS
jgi:acyl carrier protein